MKTDFKKTMPGYKAKRGQFAIVDIPEMKYLSIDGAHGPASDDFAAALEALYPVAYNLKFASKTQLDKDYVVPPLEALWWAEDMATFTTRFDQSQWQWSAMIMVPDWITSAMYNDAIKAVAEKKQPASLEKIRMLSLAEGKCVQTLHIGSYSDEGPVLKEMHASFIPANDLKMTGKHHEIYFNDFRRVAPEKLRTILRQPV